MRGWVWLAVNVVVVPASVYAIHMIIPMEAPKPAVSRRAGRVCFDVPSSPSQAVTAWERKTKAMGISVSRGLALPTVLLRAKMPQKAHRAPPATPAINMGQAMSGASTRMQTLRAAIATP